MAVKRSGTVYMDTGEVVEKKRVERVEIDDSEPLTKPIVEQLVEVKEAKRQLSEMAVGSKIIYKARSAFPFQLFPDEIVVETDKITVIHRSLWFKTVSPIPLDNMMSVSVTRGILFASMSFEITGFETNPGDISHLWPSDAARAKRFIIGLIQARKQQIDLTHVTPDDIREHVEEIGKLDGEIEALPMA